MTASAANPAPGFKTAPRSRIVTRPAGVRVRVTVGGEVIADTRAAIEMKEGDYPAVLYIPRQDVKMERLARTSHTTYCPFKGHASYYSILNGAENSVWSYEQPYDEMLEIKDLLAFYPNKVDSIAASNG
ncbi:MAG: DUF427 domain-containing protein [Burkholderiales bacterium]